MNSRSELNSALRKLYDRAWVQMMRTLPKDRKLSEPQFVDVPDAYLEAPRKLMIVGQQTNGWDAKHEYFGEALGSDPVGEIISIYRGFNLGEKYYSSPFWAASHILNDRVNPAGPKYGFIWTNLIKMDQDQRRPDPKLEAAICDLGIVREEVAILAPDVVVFFTGRPYDRRLLQTFPGANFEEISGSELVRLKHAELPKSSFRTHHPKHLWIKRKQEVLEKIVGQVNGSRS